MRNIFTLIIFLFLGLSAYNQNPLMQEFGTSYGDVHQFLNGRNCEFQLGDEVIRVQTGQIKMIYKFQGGNLYEISMEKTYSGRKSAEGAYDSFKMFYSATGAEIVEQVSEKKEGSFVSLLETEYNEVSRFQTENKDFKVKLLSQSVKYAPEPEKASLNEEIDSYFGVSAEAMLP